MKSWITEMLMQLADKLHMDRQEMLSMVYAILGEMRGGTSDDHQGLV